MAGQAAPGTETSWFSGRAVRGGGMIIPGERPFLSVTSAARRGMLPRGATKKREGAKAADAAGQGNPMSFRTFFIARP